MKQPKYIVLSVLLQLLTGAAATQAAGLLIADGGFGGVLEIQEHRVQVTINNGIAVTEVTQVFRNTENRQLEALYTFPVPKGASVANFSMWINGREMVGEVVEKERARQIYNSYKQQARPKDPGLLEQADFKTFEMRIFPIAPQAEQRVQITYYQELDFDHDWATYVYPLATVDRPGTSLAGLDTRTRGAFGLTLEVRSEVPITALESPSHGEDFAVVRHADDHWQASLEASGGDLSRDLVLAYHTSRPHTGVDLIASREPGEDGYFLLTLTAGEELEKLVDGMDYVFVLDISGSMEADGKLAISRGSLGAFVEALGENDRFEVITFNVAARELFRELRTADAESRPQAVAFLSSQEARGGTFLEPALRSAYRYKDSTRPLNVILLSDGMTEPGERQTLLRLVAERPAGTRVFAIGVGNEVNRPLLEQIAQDAGGLAAFVSRGDDFDRQAQAFRRKLLRPVATDLEITLEGADAYDLEPQKLPGLFYGMPVRLYGRYRNDGPVSVRLRADINGTPLERTVQIEIPKDAENPEIERMWAWHRIDRLLADADRAGNRKGVIDEIVRLGEGYSIVTEYTSFLVLENDDEYRRWQIERRNASRIERDRRSLTRVRAELERLRTKSMDKSLEGLGPAGPKEELAAQEPAAPAVAPSPSPSRRADPPSAPRLVPARRSSRDVDFGGGGGGGAIDLGTLGLVAALLGLGWAGRRTKP
jgi:Ca-activated chloride channel family protein